LRLLVTGGAGFIGSAFCRHVVEETKDEVLNLDALTYAAAPGSLTPLEGATGYGFVHGSVTDGSLIRRVLAQHQPNAVLHLAAETHVDRSIETPQVFVATNVMGTAVLLDAVLAYWRSLKGAARERFRFLHVSTDEVYGSLGRDGVFTEKTPYAPRSPYSASKAGADHLVAAWFHTYGLPVVISNCSNNYGPYQFPEKLIPLMIINALEGRDLPVYGDGRQVRDWLHVEDHVRALRLILERGHPGERYNIGSRSERTNLDVVRGICDLLDEVTREGRSRRELIRFSEDRPGHDRRYAIDPSKIERELGWRPKVRFEEGLRDTVRWYLQRRDWWEPLRKRYAGQRLGSPATSS
jgi:dTDP-glucose 4,6-dehydratase